MFLITWEFIAKIHRVHQRNMCQYLHIIISEKAISSRKSLRESKCVNAQQAQNGKKNKVQIERDLPNFKWPKGK